MPECLRNIIIFSVDRKCCAPLVICFLEKLRFPNLQCAAMMYIKDFDYFKQLLSIWNESKAKASLFYGQSLKCGIGDLRQRLNHKG